MICPVIIPGMDTTPATDIMLSSGVSAVLSARRTNGLVAGAYTRPFFSSI
jgi:hypothetical protein